MKDAIQLEQLCRRAQSGDMAAASDLVAEYYERIFSYFRRLSGDETEAADLTQKTFFKIWLSLSKYEGRSSFSTWIHGIAHHVYLDWCRQKRPLDHPSDEWWAARPAAGQSPFEDTAERDLAHRLYALVDQLEDGIKQVVHIHYYQGLSIKETAEALGIATSTVKYRLREALHSLRNETLDLKKAS